MQTPDITKPLVELIRRTAVELPLDVENALREARDREKPNTPACSALETILQDVAQARLLGRPLCQDTGTPLFFVDHPRGWSPLTLKGQIRSAVVRATDQALLRPNAVNSLTGENSGNNLGAGMPGIAMDEWSEAYLRIRLLLKGGGSENMGTQYSLPNESLRAGRDLDGVRRVVLHAVHQAQGRGCAPGIVGVCIGGDRGSGYAHSKRQLLRPLEERSVHPELAFLEDRLLREANSLGIGPMGFGGRSTLLGVKIGCLYRLPASFFVTVSYMCWACRRRQMIYRGEGLVEYT